MDTQSIWIKFPETYRQNEVKVLAQWINSAQSGSVVGLPGCGRSNLLSFLCSHPTALRLYIPEDVLQVALIPVDLHILPASDISTFYRVLLRAFYQARRRCDEALQEEITKLYLANADKHDAFLTQSALHELLFLFQEREIRVVLVLNYFHHFLQEATPKIVDNLRGLRDGFRHMLCLIVGLHQEVAYLPDPSLLGELYELLDRNVCWVGAMSDQDARDLVARATVAASQTPNREEIDAILRLSGNFPALLNLISYWWLGTSPRPPVGQWGSVLMNESNISHRLAKMWHGLSQEEQFVLSELQRLRANPPDNAELGDDVQIPLKKSGMEQVDRILKRLAQKGVCQKTKRGWQILGDLFASYIGEVGPSSRGRIWQDKETQEIYQGTTPITSLAPLERQMLQYFLDNPKVPHEKEELMIYLWPDKYNQIIDNDLQQLVYRLRKKVDTSPPQYIITWKGRPGGYKFYPEGCPL